MQIITQTEDFIRQKRKDITTTKNQESITVTMRLLLKKECLKCIILLAQKRAREGGVNIINQLVGSTQLLLKNNMSIQKIMTQTQDQ